MILDRRGWRAGPFTVGVQVCNEATAATGGPELRRCRREARNLAANRRVLGFVGAKFSLCAREMLATLNAAPGGPVPTVATSTTYLGLTREGPGVTPAEPDRHYPTGRRHFARVVPADDAQAAAMAAYAKRIGLERVFVLDDREAFGQGLAAAFTVAAGHIGLPVAGTASWDGDAAGYGTLADRLGRAGVDGVVLAGTLAANGPRLIRDLRTRLGRSLAILAPDGFADAEPIVEAAGALAEGVVITIATVPVTALPPRGRRLAAAFERRFGAKPCCYAMQTAEAAEIILDAIARSDGTRTTVLDAVFDGRPRDGLLGRFRFDRHGDTSLNAIGVYAIRDARLRFVTSMAPHPRLLARG